MKKTIITLLLSLFSATYSSGVMASKIELSKELTEAETKTLQEGKFVVKIQEIKGSAWPEITYYALIEASPLEAIGIFAAYDIQKDYVPNVIKSSVVKHITATDVHTEYELHVPFPLSNAHYTHGAKLFQYDSDYELTWYMVKSTSTDEVRGSAYFTPSAGKTLFRYQSYIRPKSIFGGLVKKLMLKDVEKTISAIRSHIEKLKRENSPLLTKYSEFINRALKGEFVYQDQIQK
jgi:hypothetical protein